MIKHSNVSHKSIIGNFDSVEVKSPRSGKTQSHLSSRSYAYCKTFKCYSGTSHLHANWTSSGPTKEDKKKILDS